jgi:SAM-dependent methyltransferase
MSLASAISRGWAKARRAASEPPFGSEIRVDHSFTSLEDYHRWRAAHPDHERSDACIEAIMRHGFVHPMSGERIPASQVGPVGDPREGMAYRSINSRQRAVLHAIEQYLGGRRDARIFAPEAVTGFGLFMRGWFPKFLGAEYTDDPDLRREMYPIPHEDLCALSLPSDTFDLVTTNEVLEHVPDLDAALREMCRVLVSGGRHIGTMPFHFLNAVGVVHARIVESQLVHLREPEYHGDPFGNSGSLVFEIPGWDIVERAQAAGFSRVSMRLMASSRFGYTARGSGGVFVLDCTK